MAQTGRETMAGPLTQDFDVHVPFAFVAVPQARGWANRSARVRRWFLIAFVQSWLAIWLYRAKVRMRASHVPIVPVVCDTLSRSLFGVSIGDGVGAGPGLMISHGNVVIDGRTRIGRNCQINPWVTIGLTNSRKVGFSAQGPTIGDNVHIGTGAKVLGPITIGDHVRIGANAVVISDVPANVTVVGIPARAIGITQPRDGDGSSNSDASVIAELRREIVAYKLKRQSLKSLTATLLASFDAASDGLIPTRDRVQEDLIFLDAIAATGGEESQQVLAAIDAIDSALQAATADESQ